ncbi:MAG: hypothetical protein ACRD0K_00065 [Egibacteraceae bacterium]
MDEPAPVLPTEDLDACPRDLSPSYSRLTAHVFDKIRSIDMTLGEFERLLASGEVIEEHQIDCTQLKELLLVIGWRRPPECRGYRGPRAD